MAALNQRVRDVLEREGLGPSRWRERDCITLARAMIRELSGSKPAFDLPGWAEGLTEREAIRRAPRAHHRSPQLVHPRPGGLVTAQSQNAL